MSEAEQIDDIKQRAGINYADEEEEQVIPPDVSDRDDGKLFFLCTFNDGTKSPLGFSGDNLILPDCLRMFYTKTINEKIEATEVPMVAHRSSDNDKNNFFEKDEQKLHKKINESLQFLEFHNASTESWFDR
jgi:hypothetical protein